MLNSRRVARELALLTVSQLKERAEVKPVGLGELIGRASAMLASEAHERLNDAAADLVGAEKALMILGDEALSEGKLEKRQIEAAIEGIRTAQEAVELVGSALELPTLVAMAGDEAVKKFALELVERYLAHAEAIDGHLAQAAKRWSLERMASMDRDVMRLAIGELLHAPEVPVEVAINEAVELAKKYGGQDSGRFVNGILGAIAPEAEGLRRGPSRVV